MQSSRNQRAIVKTGPHLRVRRLDDIRESLGRGAGTTRRRERSLPGRDPPRAVLGGGDKQWYIWKTASRRAMWDTVAVERGKWRETRWGRPGRPR